ncbi:hypothetical protein [Frigoribacterium sp. VKM Ac-2530]|uniref:hypothetical protein n=1 Tax=Frigoribacterium sp. VKM Ac-2530 TaxID=2783822 RepID=UPI00188D89C1|nr:hypothetical protein [Frigoribacterium sp. VKM Ac-2530]MBF4578928.1 hypothetical protein [Frigoribacterium sp. VKM Ac-2530]
MNAPCDRCGIEVAARGMLCGDCLDVLEMTKAEMRDYTNGLIRTLKTSDHSDSQIAVYTGLSQRTVERRRKVLGIPPVTKPARQFWSDPEKALESNLRGIYAHNARRSAA